MKPATMTSAQAAAFLGVKAATLYAYVARGQLRALPGKDGRSRRYLTEDLAVLRTRHDARSGHGAVASAALSFGQPVLDSTLCRLDATGPAYRGWSAVELAQRGVSVEEVAQLLWSPVGGPPLPPLAHQPDQVLEVLHLAGSPGVDCAPVVALQHALATFWTQRPLLAGAALPVRAAHAALLLRTLASAPALAVAPHALVTSARAPSVATALTSALGGDATHAPSVSAMAAALVLCADHELNASSFAARVAAGTGADLVACVVAAMATHSGPLHGRAPDRFESLLLELADADQDVALAVRSRAAQGQVLAGFGHPLYPHGDPRVPPLLRAAQQVHGQALPPLLSHLLQAAADHLGLHPTLDVGLVVLCQALKLPPGAAVCTFAVGRMVGWVAHALEQQHSGQMVRPRARYVGP